MNNLEFFLCFVSFNNKKYTYLVLCFFCIFAPANAEVNEETGHVEEQGEVQGEEVKAGLFDNECV